MRSSCLNTKEPSYKWQERLLTRAPHNVMTSCLNAGSCHVFGVLRKYPPKDDISQRYIKVIICSKCPEDSKTVFETSVASLVRKTSRKYDS